MERLPGFRDSYPEPVPQSGVWSSAARQYIFNGWREIAVRYGFQEYDGPPLEPLELFTTKSGDEIVGQLYSFEDKGGRTVALRPEMTPTLARMIAAHERNYRKPVKWFSIPQLFRYERQQKGRLREHFQFNADIFGETDPAADAELISLLIDSLRRLGLTADDFVVRLSSRTAWERFYESQQGTPDRAFEFFQIIDKLEREDPAVTAEKLRALSIDGGHVQAFIESGEPTPELESIVVNLRARGLGDFVKIDYHVIRGLAYYTGTVFEAFAKRSNFRAIAGGGRYDHLVKLISGGKVNLPALGFGMGDVVLTELLRESNLLPDFKPSVDVCCLIESEPDRPAILGLVQKLREAGLSVEYSFTPAKPEKQFKRALELGAEFTIRLQRSEPETGRFLVKDLSNREETRVDSPDAVIHYLRTVG